jgi:UDP-N-acetylglucosamine 2-epimerase (non-hydrolysing)
MHALLSGKLGVELRPPCSHDDMLRAMLEADLVLSDSGGMQEEAPMLGVPLLVLRDRTERPEGIAAGNIALVGTRTDRIVAAVRRLLGDRAALARMSRPALPYGDGHSAERIAGILADWLSLPSRSRAA